MGFFRKLEHKGTIRCVRVSNAPRRKLLSSHLLRQSVSRESDADCLEQALDAVELKFALLANLRRLNGNIVSDFSGVKELLLVLESVQEIRRNGQLSPLFTKMSRKVNLIGVDGSRCPLSEGTGRQKQK